TRSPSHGSRLRAILLFFFSSRRRHTRFSRDWSSDVCSSDLLFAVPYMLGGPLFGWLVDQYNRRALVIATGALWSAATAATGMFRSEERRVGKERRWRWGRRQDAKRESTRGGVELQHERVGWE